MRHLPKLLWIKEHYNSEKLPAVSEFSNCTIFDLKFFLRSKYNKSPGEIRTHDLKICK